MTEPSKVQALTLRTLAEGGELRTARWNESRGGDLRRNGSVFRLVPRKSIQIMQSRGWIAHEPVAYGQSMIGWHLTENGRALAEAAQEADSRPAVTSDEREARG
jgi:hypothetical protein